MVTLRLCALGLVAVAGTASAAAAKDVRKLLGCMTNDEAKKVAADFGTLISSYTDELAEAALTEDYHDYTESVKVLMNACAGADITPPAGEPLYTDRAGFMEGQGAQPINNFEQLNFWHTCKTVTFRWKTTDPPGRENPDPVIGLVTAVARKQNCDCEFPWVIHTVYSEFDSGTWLQNLQAVDQCLGAAANSTSTATSSTVAETSATESSTLTSSSMSLTSTQATTTSV